MAMPRQWLLLQTFIGASSFNFEDMNLNFIYLFLSLHSNYCYWYFLTVFASCAKTSLFSHLRLRPFQDTFPASMPTRSSLYRLSSTVRYPCFHADSIILTWRQPHDLQLTFSWKALPQVLCWNYSTSMSHDKWLSIFSFSPPTSGFPRLSSSARQNYPRLILQ